MKVLRLLAKLLPLFSLLLICSSAFADQTPPDPVMQVDDPICESTQPCAPLVGGPNGTTPFTFSANGSGGGSISFEVNPTNEGGFSSLDIEVLGVFDVTSCTSNEFNCNVTILDNAVTDMFFTESRECSDCQPSGGFPSGDVFTIDLDNPNTPGIGGWGSNQGFTAEANLQTAPTTPLIPSPEPSSLLLLGIGSAAIGGKIAWKRFF